MILFNKTLESSNAARDCAFWERFWSSSVASFPLGASESELLRDIDGLGAMDMILEIGIGDGRNLSTLRRKCGRLIGIDISPAAVQRVTTRFPLNNTINNTIELRVDSGYTIPLADSSCDLVVATDLMNHLSEPHIICGEIRRVLKKGGQFIGNAMSVRDPSRSTIISNGKAKPSGEFFIPWTSIPNHNPVWLTMRFYECKDLRKLFRDFVWIAPPSEYFREDAGHPPPFDSAPHKHVFWKLHLQKP